jgi:hypothetical protein
MNQKLASVFVILAGTALPAQAVEMTMVSSARECATGANNVAQAIQQVQRQVSVDNTDVTKRVDKNEEAREKKKEKMNACSPEIAVQDPNTGSDVLVGMIGANGFYTHREGEFDGSLYFGGTNVTPNSFSVELFSLHQIGFDTDGPVRMDFNFQFSGISYSAIPFVLRLDRVVDGVPPIIVSETSVMPTTTPAFRSMFVPSAGTFQLSLMWEVPETMLPPGNSLVGVDSYLVHWKAAPEPTTVALIAIGSMLFLQRFRRNG